MEPITRLTFDVAALMATHPPRWRDRNKQAIFAVSCPPGSHVGGTIEYTRWAAMPLPAELGPAMRTELVARVDVYDYAPTGAAGAPGVEWHVNFADPSLFVAYGSGLFAQDEMQVAEHPALGSLREALLAGGHKALTEENGAPTPVLVRGVERRVMIATEPDAAAGRPNGLYGNRFAAGDESAVRRAATPVDPPTITNLIAIAAPAYGHGEYTADDVESILTTAHTGFAAAARESRRAAGNSAATVIHAGFWGCGAFGGNRVMMAMLQLLAARLASIERLVFHTFDRAGADELDRALTLHERDFSPTLHREPIPMREVIDRAVGMCLRWGVSDGN